MENRTKIWLARARGWMGGLPPFVSGALGAVLVILLFQIIFPTKQLTVKDVDQAVAVAMASATPRTPDAVLVYQAVQQSIVYIESTFVDENGESSNGLGTGVIIDDSADILTSLHVVGGANKIEVTFSDGSISGAFILQETPEQDLALLRAFNTPPLIVPATLGNPATLRVGDEVFVVGNPYGLYNSMSSGVVSGFDRSFRPEEDVTLTGLIQFDAAANPGNSGGPLLDRYGRVVGVVTGVIGPPEGNFFVGIGFAVPISNVTSATGGSPPY